MNDSMNKLILSAAGREDGDQPKPQKPSVMNRILLDAIPRDQKIIFKERDE